MRYMLWKLIWPWISPRIPRTSEEERALEQELISERLKSHETDRELSRVRQNWPTALQLVGAITEHGRRNHIAESLYVIFRGES